MKPVRAAEGILTSSQEVRKAAEIELNTYFSIIDYATGEGLLTDAIEKSREINLKGMGLFDITLPSGAVVQRNGGFNIVKSPYRIQVDTVDYDHAFAWLPDGSKIIFPVCYLVHTENPEVLTAIGKDETGKREALKEILRTTHN